MADVRITNWRGPAIVKQCVDAARPLLETKADAVVTQIQNNIAINYPPASAPGECPHRRTGDLHVSWYSQFVEPGVVKIFSADKKVLWLEYGTVRMKARPFVRRSLLEKRGLFSRVEVTG